MNSSVTSREVSDFKSVISKPMLRVNFMGTSYEIALMWMRQNTFDGKSKLV